MKIYNTQEEVEKDVINGILKINDDVTFKFNLDMYININANNINANNINTYNINASDINYYAVCFAYKNIKCKSIKGIRRNNKHFCLDGEITIKKEVKEYTIEQLKEKLGEEFKIIK